MDKFNSKRPEIRFAELAILLLALISNYITTDLILVQSYVFLLL